MKAERPAMISDDEKRQTLLQGKPLEFVVQREGRRERGATRTRIIRASWISDLMNEETREISKPIRIANAIIEGPLCFRNATFCNEFLIIGSEFIGDVDLSFASFDRAASFEGSDFKRLFSLRAARAKSNLNISRCCFQDRAIFRDLKVDGVISAESTRFDIADFTRATFAKAAVFRPFDVKKSWPSAPNVMPVHPELEGKPVSFQGAAYFDDVFVGNTLEFQGAEFNEVARFEGMTVLGSAFFYPHDGTCVVFRNLVRFCYARITGGADFASARFEGDADFECFEVGGSAQWGKYNERRVDLQKYKHQPNTPRGDGVQFKGEANFGSARFKGSASFEFACFEADSTFDGIEVGGSADFRKSIFRGPVHLNDAKFRTIQFREKVMSTVPDQDRQFLAPVHLRGFTYDIINVSWPELLGEHRETAPAHSAYHRQVYTQLERTLRAMGNDREADSVYLARRSREASLRWDRVFGWDKSDSLPLRLRFYEIMAGLLDLGQRLLFNYGVRPVRLLWMSLFVLLLGAYVFAHPGAVKHRESGAGVAKLNYSQAFGLSVRLFVPVVDLATGGAWIPSEEPAPYLSRIRLSFAGYATLHRLTGAVLVPLGIAALTGFMRRRAAS